MSRTKAWSEDDIKYLTENYQLLKHKDMAKHLDTNANRVKKKLQAMGLFKDYTPKVWTQDELDELYKVIFTEKACVLAKKYNCRYSEIQKHKRRAEKMQTVKKEAEQKRPHWEYTNPDYTKLIDYYANMRF